VQIDATAFRQWYEQHYGASIGKKKKEDKEAPEKKVRSKKATKKVAKRAKGEELSQGLKDGFVAGRLLACVSSRPGQCGRADGYILEGKELEFYVRKLKK